MTNATPIREKSGRWVKGSSGNPGGRKAQPAEVKAAIEENGTMAVARMNQLLRDETAWGRGGWLEQKAQVRLLEVAQARAYGQQVAVDLGNGLAQNGSDGGMSTVLRKVYDDMHAAGDFPELRNARPAKA